MALNKGGQRALARKEDHPRVLITLDVDDGGATRKVEIPFVTGVMSDLTGKHRAHLPDVEAREFRNVNSETFDDQFNIYKPSVSITVPNRIDGKGKLGVDLAFTRMADFEPAAIARNVPPLARLFHARQALDDLLATVGGRSRAIAVLEKLLSDPDLMRALAQESADTTGPGGDEDGPAQEGTGR
ncbi:type VI secretion system contractile sheath small subunit [Niveispirillum fermenti]|uniref:type VI secretion system contractile sheath small subunit n=1 Tax=Niveispirillum fermenti TaxID=1233113 RepID=UPI003A8BF90E